jgi:hypothetical protein
LKLLGLETWPPDAPKVPIFAIFKANLQKICVVFMARDQREVFIWTFVYLGLQNLPWNFHLLPVTWNAPSFDRIFLGFPSIKLNGLFTKTKEAKTSNVDRS